MSSSTKSEKRNSLHTLHPGYARRSYMNSFQTKQYIAYLNERDRLPPGMQRDCKLDRLDEIRRLLS